MASQEFLTKAYLAYFGRPVDVTGQVYWATKTEAEVIAGFSASNESQALYGSQFDAAQVNAIYNILFNRDAEPAGLLYWLNEVYSGRLAPLEAALGILNGAANEDKTAVENKLAASRMFTDSLDTTPEILGYNGAAAAAAARSFLGTVTDTVVPTQAEVDQAVANVTAIGGAPGETFTLTAGTDNVTGTSGNDTIEGTAATLSVFDSINGGGGDDTLNLVFDTDVAGLATGVTLTSVENVVMQAAGSVTADISAWTGVSDVTVNGITASKDIDITSAASGTVSATGRQDVSVTDNAAAAVVVSAGQDATVNADAATSVRVAGTDADASKDDLFDVNAAALESLTVAVSEGATVSVNTESTALTINAAGTADTDDDGTMDAVLVEEDSAAAAVEALTVNVTADSALDLDFAAATALAIEGSADLALTETDLDAVETLTVAGSAGLSGDVSGMAALASIVSTSSGDIDLTIAATALEVSTGAGDDNIAQSAGLGATQVINTGAGNDRVALGAAANAAARVDGGEGQDTIAVVSAAVNTDHSAVISNFEVLEVSNALGQALNVANFDNIQNVVLAAGSGAFAISGLNSGATVTYGAANTGASTLTVTNALAGTNDVVNVVLDAAVTADFNTIVAADVETVNVNSTTTNATPSGVTNTVGLTIGAATALNVSGDAALVIDTALTSVETVNAAGFDAGLEVDLTGNANDVAVTAGAGDNTITGGDGDDSVTIAGDGDNTVNGGAGADAVTITGGGDNTVNGGAGDDSITITGDGDNTVDGGAGNDVIVIDGAGDNSITGGAGKDTMTGGSGVDTYVYGAASESQGVNVDTITNFDIANDVLNFSAIAVDVVGPPAFAASYLGEASGYGAVLTSLTASGATAAVLDTSTSTLYVDVNGDGVLDSADMAINLTGVTSLDDATNFVW